MKPKIIYIAGGGHSGSTLLSMIIGTSKEVFSLGEAYSSMWKAEVSKEIEVEKYLEAW